MKYRISKSEDNKVKVLVDENLIKFLEEHYFPDGFSINDPAKAISCLPDNTELYISRVLGSLDVVVLYLSTIDHEISTYIFASIDYDDKGKRSASITVRRGNIVDTLSYEYVDEDVGEIIIIVDYKPADFDEDSIMRVAIYPIIIKESDIGTIKLIKSTDDETIYLVEHDNLYNIETLSKVSDHLPENYEEV